MENFWSIMSNPLVVSIGGALVGWYLTQFTNKKRMAHEKEINDMKLKADVVVKSRMEWIKDVRELSSRLIKTYTYMYQDNERFTDYEKKIKIHLDEVTYYGDKAKQTKDNNARDVLIKRMENSQAKARDLEIKYKEIAIRLPEYIGQFSEIKFLFYSYFSKINLDSSINKRNSKLLDIMEICIVTLSNYCVDSSQVSKDELQQSLDNFMDEVSNYLKEEWEKVKRIE